MMRPFPKLMVSVHDPDNLVVFFQNPNSGMVVHAPPSGVPYPLGTILTDWNPDEFDDAPDDLIIWLTEGPKEPILEAIEVVEKIHALKVAENG